MKKCLVFALLAMSMGSIAKAEVLVSLNFALAPDRAKTTVASTGSGWRSLGALTNIGLYQTAGAAADNIYNLDLNTANRFTATQLGVNISFNHFYNFQNNASFNAMDGGTLFLGKVNNAATNDITWSQVTSYVSGQNYDGAVPQLPGSISGFSGQNGAGGSSASPLTSVFSAVTEIGSDYVFRFEGGLSGTSAYGTSTPAWSVNSIEVASVPEPGTLILAGVSLLMGGGGYGVRRFRNRKAAERVEDNSVSI